MGLKKEAPHCYAALAKSGHMQFSPNISNLQLSGMVVGLTCIHGPKSYYSVYIPVP